MEDWRRTIENKECVIVRENGKIVTLYNGGLKAKNCMEIYLSIWEQPIYYMIWNAVFLMNIGKREYGRCMPGLIVPIIRH